MSIDSCFAEEVALSKYTHTLRKRPSSNMQNKVYSMAQEQQPKKHTDNDDLNIGCMQAFYLSILSFP